MIRMITDRMGPHSMLLPSLKIIVVFIWDKIDKCKKESSLRHPERFRRNKKKKLVLIRDLVFQYFRLN